LSAACPHPLKIFAGTESSPDSLRGGKFLHLTAFREQGKNGGSSMEKEVLSVVDKRTKASYDLAIDKGAVRASDLRQIKTGPEDFGLMSYDPAFLNTAACQSAITFIDGDKGILRYRGYPIEQLAEKCSFLEVAYLILNGELPTELQLKNFVADITHHTMLHETTKRFLEGFHHDAHPMGMFISTVAALSTIYPDARNVHDPEARRLQIHRLIGKVPTIAAYAHRNSLGYPFVYPDNDLSYTENFMNMLW
jgi:citrate synthase